LGDRFVEKIGFWELMGKEFLIWGMGNGWLGKIGDQLQMDFWKRLDNVDQ